MLRAALASQNAGAFAATLGGATLWLGVCSVVGKMRILPARLSRKMMHIGTGTFYMLTWPLYTASPASPWLCAAVPALAGLRFAAVGLGWLNDPALVAGSSRSGRPEELLRGPVMYAAAHVAATVLFWRHSPCGVLALAVLCGGDGLAEVVGAGLSGSSGSGASQPAGSSGGTGSSKGKAATPGRQRRHPLARPLPHNPNKTVAGSLACFFGGAATALPLLLHFRRAGLFDAAAAAAGSTGLLHGAPLLAGVLLCSAVGAAAESASVGDADNVAVTAATALAARLYFGF